MIELLWAGFAVALAYLSYRVSAGRGACRNRQGSRSR